MPRSSTTRSLKLVHVTTVPMTLNFFRGQISYMKEHGFIVQAISSPDDDDSLAAFGCNEEIVVHPVPMARQISPASDIVSLLRLWRLFRQLRPDVVHSHSPKAALLGTLAARIAGVPIVVLSVFGLPQMTKTGPGVRVLNAVTKFECRVADKVWCDSPSMRSYIIEQKLCASEKIVVLGAGSVNGVDSQAFSPSRQSPGRTQIRELMQIPSQDIVIGFVGRITADKGMHELAQAWRQLSTERTDVHLLLVGPFEAQDPLHAEDLALFHDHPRVHLTGMQSEVSCLFASMDIFVMPSHREGFGVTNIEAAAMSLPVVATLIPGCVDSVQDGVTGTLVPAKDSISLHAALQQYCADGGLRREHGQAGRRRVIAEFKPEAIWRQLDNLYRDLADKTSTQSVRASALERRIPQFADTAHPRARIAVLAFTEQRTWQSGNEIKGKKPLPIVSALAALVSVRLAARVGTAESEGVALASNAAPAALVWPNSGAPLMFAQMSIRFVRSIVLEARNADVIYADQPGVVGGLGLMVGRILCKPLIVNVVGDANESVHPSVISGFKGRVAHAILPRLQRWACANAVYANYVTSSVLQTRYPPTRAKETFASTTASALGPTRPRPFPRNQVSVVTVASLEQPYKGVSELIDAVCLCRSNGHDVRLTVIGEGRLRPELETYATAVAPGFVDFTGYIFGQALYDELGRHDIFALASWTEGLPRALIEAMADGLPAVATGVGGVPELIEPERIAAVRDPSGLADRLMDLLSDEEAWSTTIEYNLRVSGELLRSRNDVLEGFVTAIANLAVSQ